MGPHHEGLHGAWLPGGGMSLADDLGSMEVRMAASSVGVMLRGEEGQPFHCDKRMEVRGGIAGVDYARCGCGVALRRIDSPHTNGGVILTDAELEELGDRVWVASEPGDEG